MDAPNDIREFLTTRRARRTREQVGLPVIEGRRRVPGLRREEVALLAGVSIDYYVRLERGRLPGVSPGVLDAVSRALQLDEVERAHLFDLVRATRGPHAAGAVEADPSGIPVVGPGVQRMLDALLLPAWVRNSRSDFLAGNALGRALYAPLFRSASGRGNTARYMFLDPDARDFYVDWREHAAAMVGVLRADAGRDPHDSRLAALVDELVARSDEFRTLWATHDVAMFRGGVKRLHHPVAGRLELSHEMLQLGTAPGQTVIVYSAEPGSPTEEALRLLTSWATSTDPQVATTDPQTG